MAERDYLIKQTELGGLVSALISDQTSDVRAALNAVLPSTGAGALPGGVASSSWQNPDGTWPAPVRGVGAGARLFIGRAGKAYPGVGDGLRPGDLYLSPGTYRQCLTADGVTPVSWLEMLTSTTGGGTGGIVTTDPTDSSPTPVVTPPPGTLTPSMLATPMSTLGSEGTWSSTGSTSISDALADGSKSGTTATPSTAGNARIRLQMTPLLLASGNDVLVTLFGAKGSPAGEVQVTLTRGGANIAYPIKKTLTTTATNIEFRWPAKDLPILSSWSDVVVDILRVGGTLDLSDVAEQSVPPVSTTAPPTGTTAPSSSAYGGIFGSQLAAAPRSIYTDAKTAYVNGAGQVVLGCYGDAPMVVTAAQTTPRVKVTTTVAGGNTATGTGWADSVPIPATVKAPTNQWKVLVVVSPSTDEVWEFVGVGKDATTGAWTCSRGGKAKMSTSKGVMPAGTGITGSGLALQAPAITLDEARRAKGGDVAALGHTLGLNLPSNFYASGYWATPATRTDGTLSSTTEEAARKTTPLAGDRVRLKASFSTANLTGLAKAIAETLKTYGAVVMGGSDKPSLICESGEVEQAASGIDPWGGVLAGQGVDQILSWLKATDLEFVPAGWLSTATTITETPMSGTVTTTPTSPTTPTTGTTGTSLGRIQVKMPAGVKWMSGASCIAIQDSSEGMGSAYAQWRGEGCYFARTWWDAAGADPNGTLAYRWKNWHASIDCGPGFFYRGESMGQAAAGAFDSRWTSHLQQARQWWASRRDPSLAQVFISPAHEMNGNWYPHSVNSGNVQDFVTAWKRYRSIQLKVFPEAILTFNANRDSVGANMDWRDMVPGRKYGGGKITDWVDCGAVDYYNMDPNASTLAQFNSDALAYDGWGGPKGIQRHLDFWKSVGLPMTVPEWSNNATQGDSPAYADGMNQFMRANAGTGPGQVCGDALFNLSQGYSGLYAVYGDTVGSPNFAARYKALTWGN